MFSLLVALTLMAGACASGTLATGAPATTEALTATPAMTEAPAATEAMTATPATTEAPVTAPSPVRTSQPATVVATAVPTSQLATGGTRIRLTIGDTVLTGRLWDNATARDLIAQLPLTLTFSDYNGREKIGRLPWELSTDGVPAGDDPLPRDIGYYAPWGNLVFYYGDVGYFNGIVRLGQFDDSVDAIARRTADFTARIELAN